MRGRQPAPRNPSEPWTLRDVRAADPCVTTAAGVPSPETRSPHIAGSHHNLFDSRRRRSRLDNDFLRGGGRIVGIVRLALRLALGVASSGLRLFIARGVLMLFDGCVVRVRCRRSGDARIRCGLGGRTVICSWRWSGAVATADGNASTKQPDQGHVPFRHDSALRCGFECQLAGESLLPAI
jgi:hypothetical protein